LTLAFDHPLTGERLAFESKLPRDLEVLMDELDGLLGSD
jgi:hypothetical protein